MNTSIRVNTFWNSFASSPVLLFPFKMGTISRCLLTISIASLWTSGKLPDRKNSLILRSRISWSGNRKRSIISSKGQRSRTFLNTLLLNVLVVESKFCLARRVSRPELGQGNLIFMLRMSFWRTTVKDCCSSSLSVFKYSNLSKRAFCKSDKSWWNMSFVRWIEDQTTGRMEYCSCSSAFNCHILSSIKRANWKWHKMNWFEKNSRGSAWPWGVVGTNCFCLNERKSASCWRNSSTWSTWFRSEAKTAL